MGKIILNGVTYSGTIYEAGEVESGQGVEWLPATRIIYDNEVSELSADNAQNAIDALKELNDELSEKIPFSLMYNSATQEYGYIDNSGKFIAFSNGGSQEEANVKVIPSGNGDTEIAQIKINNEYTSIYGYGNSLTYKGNAYSTLPDIDVVDQNTKNQIYIAKGSEGTYTYEKTDEDGNKTEETLNAKVNDMLFSDGKSWSVLFSGGDSVDYASEISGGTVVGKLNISGTEKDIIIPNATASADDILGTIVFSKDDDGQYGYYKGETFIPFSEGGSSVTISGLLEDGTDIATLNIDGTDYIIKTPSITGVKFEKVNSYAELPNPGEEGTIYLVLKETTSTDNIYTEYIWVVNNEVGAYEMLGDTAVKAVDIEVSAEYTEGTKIATITVDENDTELFIPEDIVELTKAEYDALSDEEKLDKTFFINDWNGGSASNPRIIELIGESSILEDSILFDSATVNKYDVLVLEVMGLRNGETMYRGTALSLPIDYLELEREYPIQIDYGNSYENNYASGYAIYKKNTGITYWYARLNGVQPPDGMKCKVYGVKYCKSNLKSPMADYIKLSAIMIDNRYDTDKQYKITTGINIDTYGDNLILEEKVQLLYNNDYMPLGFWSEYEDEEHNSTRIITGTTSQGNYILLNLNTLTGGGGISVSISNLKIAPVIIKWGQSNYFINGTKTSNSYSKGINSSSPISFARLTTLNSGQYLLFYGRMFNREELVKEYIPVKRISDGEVGFYDTVNKTFHPNEGNGKFIAIY